MNAPSARAIALIEYSEIGGSYSPLLSCPGAYSGITGGIGYDFGQQSAARIAVDWAALPPSTLIRLQSYAGRTGAAAQSLIGKCADIRIPEPIARHVFETNSIPRASSETAFAFPGCSALSGDSFGALVSLVYNRGPGMGSISDAPDTRREMRAIRDALADGELADIPALFLAMRWVWAVNPSADPSAWKPRPGLAGLFVRRKSEADLFAAGLASQGTAS